jgi:signal transduction histidine kinase
VADVNVVQNESLFAFVISSVLDNAIKFTEPGGHVRIETTPEDKMIQVRVTDNGRGIAPEKIDQLFKPFSRAESAVDFSYEGMGLSLFLNRLILTYTGGDIGIVSSAEGGTEVTIKTPTES